MRKGLFTISAFGFCLVAFLAVVQAQNITTLAGGGPNNLPARSASIGVPWAVLQRGTTTYISDNLSNRIFKVDGSGNLTVFAGNIVANYDLHDHGDGHPATTASLSNPQGIALDSAGNLYIADTANNAVRVVEVQNGTIQTVAGDGSGLPGYVGDGAAATSATLNNPGGVWSDADGNIYIADTVNSVIRVVNMQTSAIHFPGSKNAATVDPGNIATIAGTGTAGWVDGPANTAQFNNPGGLFVTGSANSGTVLIYVADTINNRVRVVNTMTTDTSIAGVSITKESVATVAGNGTACANPTGACGDNNASHSATSANLNNPVSVFADASHNIYIADTNDNKIREVTSTGAISTIAGNGSRCTFGAIPCGEGGLATSAELWFPTGVALDATGNVMIADQNDDAIRTIISLNLQTTVGAVFNTAYSGDKSQTITGTATNAEMREPSGLASDASGNVFIADTHNSTIRKVSNGIITSVVGNGFSCFTASCGDGGPASAAQLSFPFGVAFDKTGNMWIADTGNESIRVVNNQGGAIQINGSTPIQPGNILTVVGTGTVCASSTDPCGDGGAAISAQLNFPSGIAFDPTSNLYIADTNDNRIRVVNNLTHDITVAGVTIHAGQIATIAGDGNPCADPTTPCGDEAAATAANLNVPGGVAVDGVGNIYIADTGDNRVRVVDTAGTIHAFAGTGTACTTDCKNGILAVDALLDAPQGLFVDLAGNVFIADAFDFEAREVTTDHIIHGVAGNETRGFSGDGGLATSAQLALPYGVSGDPFGNLLIADQKEWRVRKVTSLVVTQPRADLSSSTLAFSNQPIHSTSPARSVTLSNDSFGNTLTISTNWTLSGTNASEFAIASNTCTGSLPAGSSCTIKITFSPAAKGNRVATLTITDNAGGVPNTHQTVSLSGTGLAATGLGEQVDYFGDGKADLTVWRPSNGTFYSLDSSNKELIKQWGVSTDAPLIGDYDGDGKTDIGVWRPSNGTWYILQSNGKEVIRAWGAKGDIPVPGDYDGDGKTDFAIFRPSNGTWYILQSSNLQEVIRPWGAKGDIPVPGDYDGDGKTDFAIFRPSNGTWYILQSRNLQEVIRPWGAKGDIPVPGDYDGDGRNDFAIFRPSNATWYILQIANLQEVIRVWGAKGDIPVARDYDGDGKADFAVWRPSNGTWYVSQSSTGKTFTKAWGVSTDIPMNKPVGQ